MCMLGEACLLSNAYKLQTPDYTREVMSVGLNILICLSEMALCLWIMDSVC